MNLVEMSVEMESMKERETVSDTDDMVAETVSVKEREYVKT